MKRLLTAALALSLLGGTAAVAQPGHHDDHGGYAQQGDHHDDRGGYAQQGDHRDDHGGYGQQGDHRDNHNHGYDRSREVHARNDQRQAYHHWARGQRLPATYYQDRGHYVDYRTYHLRRPPHGYQWVQADDNYALVALATGLIASIVVANH